MALTVVDGLMGSGKSYYVVNGILVDTLVNSRRPVAITENLEVQTELLVTECAERTSRAILRSPEKFREFRQSILDRITWLVPEERDVLDQDTGRPLLVRGEGAAREFRVQREDEEPPEIGWQVHRAHVMGEFWYFTKPNSVIIYDEAADRLNSRKWQESMATKLQSYINHSRHYKDDLYFIAQSVEDLDKQLREKFHYIHNVRNSLKQPMVEKGRGVWSVIFGGMRWPVQFFIVDQMVREGRKLTPFLTRHIWPKKKGFALYNSFSAPAEMAGKSLGDGEGESEDFGMPLHRRLKPWLERLPALFWLVGLAAAVCVFLWAASTGNLQKWLRDGLTPAQKAPEAVAESNTGSTEPLNVLKLSDSGELGEDRTPPPVITDYEKGEETTSPGETVSGGREPDSIAQSQPPLPLERVVAISNRYVFTDRGSYSVDAVPAELEQGVSQFLGILGRDVLHQIQFVAGPSVVRAD